MSVLTPRDIVSELDRYIVGQAAAKRAVAIALRNRWRRQQLTPDLREEVMPKNILMIGPTGVGKTEISRRLARLANAPFLKVEATKFTEVGYVGRDVEQIVRDLVEIGINVADSGNPMAQFEIPGMPGSNVGMLNLNDLLGKALGGRQKLRKMKVVDAYAPLIAEESDKLIDNEALVQDAIKTVENDGIVFLDEIDKICAREGGGRGGADVSREGVQRDLLPLIEGTTVSTKHGPVKTDHILFIASGAFHTAKPSDLLPELQGRLPIRVELQALTRDDFRRILTEPEASLIKQYKALMATEGVSLEFTEDGIDALADAAAEVNATVENIGARRLQTVMERVLEEVSFHAPDSSGARISVDKNFVTREIGALAKNSDLSRFIL